ncbi:MAG TPA: glycosyltransferase [Silvibacterium sp.]|nr:glycosyltransferase [Silvibacterium sp.]
MKPRVLHLIGSNCIGGPEKQILHHAVSMQDSPYQIEIGSFHDLLEWPEVLRGAEERNIPTFCLQGGPRLELVSELAAILREREGVLLCTHGFKANVVGYFAARKTGTRHIAFLRGWTAETMRVVLYEMAERFVLSRASHVVCVSRKQAEQVGRLRRRSRSQPIVVPNAMLPPWSRLDHNQPVTRDSLNIPHNAFVFGSVGRLSAEKGHRFMISAFREANAIFGAARPLRLIVVGDGREQEALERQAADYGLRDKIYFAGFQGNPGDWMALFDCMVQPSLTEGTPNSVLEALCLSVPVIATAVGGVPDLIANGENGLLVPPKNAASLANAMGRLILDIELRLRLANAAHETSRAYSPSAQKEKLLAVYRTVFAS